jgi:hypothetical protein
LLLFTGWHLSRALSDAGCVIAEVTQLYHRPELYETTPPNLKGKRVAAYGRSAELPNLTGRAPTDSGGFYPNKAGLDTKPTTKRA